MLSRSVGVEEEFLLVEDGAPRLADVGQAAVDRASARHDDSQFEHELKRPQAELASSATTDIAELAADLDRLRGELARAAREQGVRLVASGTSPTTDPPRTTDSARYHRMDEQFGIVAREQLTCGMHVHVAVESPQEGIAVLNRIRSWLSPLTALSANSPLYRELDTGYASYRSVLWGRWPTAGPVEPFADADDYDRVIEDLVRSGAAADEGMIYFDARLSRRYPTIEIRVCDVCARSEDAALIAALARALVETAAQQERDGARTPAVRSGLIRAASWRASRWGMSADLVDVTSLGLGGTRVLPAWQAVERLLDLVGPALLRAGDVDRVTAGLDRITAAGTGAHVQRAAFAAGGAAGALDQVTVHPA